MLGIILKSWYLPSNPSKPILNNPIFKVCKLPKIRANKTWNTSPTTFLHTNLTLWAIQGFVSDAAIIRAVLAFLSVSVLYLRSFLCLVPCVSSHHACQSYVSVLCVGPSIRSYLRPHPDIMHNLMGILIASTTFTLPQAQLANAHDFISAMPEGYEV